MIVTYLRIQGNILNPKTTRAVCIKQPSHVHSCVRPSPYSMTLVVFVVDVRVRVPLTSRGAGVSDIQLITITCARSTGGGSLVSLYLTAINNTCVRETTWCFLTAPHRVPPLTPTAAFTLKLPPPHQPCGYVKLRNVTMYAYNTHQSVVKWRAWMLLMFNSPAKSSSAVYCLRCEKITKIALCF